MKQTFATYIFLLYASKTVFSLLSNKKIFSLKYRREFAQKANKIIENRFRGRNLKVLDILFTVSNVGDGDKLLERIEKEAKSRDVRGFIVDHASNKSIAGTLEATNKTLLELFFWIENNKSPGSVLKLHHYAVLRFYQYDELTIYKENQFTVSDIGDEEILDPFHDDSLWDVNKDNIYGINANTRRNGAKRHATDEPDHGWILKDEIGVVTPTPLPI